MLQRVDNFVKPGEIDVDLLCRLLPDHGHGAVLKGERDVAPEAFLRRFDEELEDASGVLDLEVWHGLSVSEDRYILPATSVAMNWQLYPMIAFRVTSRSPES